MYTFIGNALYGLGAIITLYLSYKLTNERMSNVEVYSSSAFGREKMWFKTFGTYATLIGVGMLIVWALVMSGIDAIIRFFS